GRNRRPGELASDIPFCAAGPICGKAPPDSALLPLRSPSEWTLSGGFCHLVELALSGRCGGRIEPDFLDAWDPPEDGLSSYYPVADSHIDLEMRGHEQVHTRSELYDP